MIKVLKMPNARIHMHFSWLTLKSMVRRFSFFIDAHYIFFKEEQFGIINNSFVNPENSRLKFSLPACGLSLMLKTKKLIFSLQ